MEHQVAEVAAFARVVFDAARLGDPEARVRQAAAAALGELGPVARDAAADLNLALQDSDAAVRRAATDALLRITGGAP